VRASWIECSRATNPDTDRLIDQSWTNAMARPGVKLFDGEMCRLESWQASPATLQLQLSRISCKTFLGTNLSHPELAEKYGRNVLANPLGLSAALLTADGFIMFGRRNSAVAYYPNRIHPVAGCLEPDDGADVFAAVERELREELGFNAGDIAEIRCRGMVEDPALLQPELVLTVRSTRTRAEIERQVDAGEHSGSWSVPATADAIAAAIENPVLTPVGAGALLLCGIGEGDPRMDTKGHE
jgi:8-oxo-dGTP pyrophosphatase MutT (NUDIX family)